MTNYEKPRINTVELAVEAGKPHKEVFTVASREGWDPIRASIPAEVKEGKPELAGEQFMLLLDFGDCCTVCEHREIISKKTLRAQVMSWVRTTLDQRAQTQLLGRVEAALQKASTEATKPEIEAVIAQLRRELR